MTGNNRRWNREDVTVPCLVDATGDERDPAHGWILNLSQGGVMLSTEIGFAPDQRVTITIDPEYDALLFEFSETLSGTVRWAQATSANARFPYQVGISFDQDLPHRLHLTEQ